MEKAVIVFDSKNSSTRRYGEEIAKFLFKRDVEAELIPISEFDTKYLENADYLLVSGGGKGHFLSIGSRDNDWVNFVKKLPALKGIKTALFTTYTIFAIGVRNMKKYLEEKTEALEFVFKSRDGSLSVSDQLTLNDFLR
jgi:flavodoxin